jgi:formate dehydrogenase alpha subunit
MRLSSRPGMETVSLVIDGVKVSAEKGATVLEAAESAGIYIPTLCYHPDLTPYGACRLCVVEIENMRGLPTACTTPATDGMVVHTNTPAVNEVRRTTIELLLADHPSECLICHRRERCGPFDICLRQVAVTDRCVTCTKNGNCELQKVVDYLGIKELPFRTTTRSLPIHTDNPFFDRDYNRCILCGRCVRMCEEVRGVGAIAFTYRGSQALVGTAFDRPLKDVDCKFCGACLDACPTAALIERSDYWPGLPEREVATICPYCGVGCQLKLGIKDDKIISVSPDREGPANQGQACVKGRFSLAEVVHHPDRFTTPLVRRNGRLEETSWDEAIDLVAEGFAEIREKYGADSLGAFSSSRCTNEENYVVQKLARAVFGTNNVDNCARICHAPSITGLAACFGSGAATNSFDQIEDADLLFVIGSNTTEAHPVVGLKVIKAANKGAKLIVADPRRIELVDLASLWLNLKPGTNIALLNGMMHVILEEGMEDKAFIARRTEGFEEFRKVVKKYTPKRASEISGVPEKDIIEAALLYARAEKAMIIYSLGMTEHTTGTANVMSLGNLAMLTGNVGRPSTGIMPLRGQNNVQGACDMGAMPNVHVGYQPVANPDIRSKFEKAWKAKLPHTPGLASTLMLESMKKGGIKGLYILGEDPAQTDADTNQVRASLKSLDFLVVQELFPTETTNYAHVILPAASFAECDGTFTNGERRIQRVRKALPALCGQENWQTVCLIAQRMGYPMSYNHSSEIMDEIASLAPMFGGVSFKRLDNGGLQWPCPTRDHPGTETMHVKSFVRGLGKFNPVEHKFPAERPDSEYPLVLTTGRRMEHYNCGSMTRRSSGILEVWPEERIEINHTDAEELGVANGEEVLVRSRRGELKVKVRVTDKSVPGVAFMSFHYPDVLTNLLTNAALDPQAKTPEFKACAIRIEKVRR